MDLFRQRIALLVILCAWLALFSQSVLAAPAPDTPIAGSTVRLALPLVLRRPAPDMPPLATLTPTATVLAATPTPSATATFSATSTPTHSATPTRTLTPVPPTVTPTATASPLPADLILHHGIVLTMEDAQPQAEAIAIRGGTILAVGSNSTVLALQGPSTVLVNLNGRTVLPGFVDPHSHLLSSLGSFNTDLRGAMALALSHGVTTLASAYTDAALVNSLRALEAAGQLPLRVSLYLNYTSNCGQVLGDWFKAYPPTRAFGERLRVNGIKIFLDGGSCGCPAYSYLNPRCGYGNLWLSQETLNAVVASASADGYQVAMHALGDRAVEQGLNAIASVAPDGSNPLRHRIEHNAVVRDDLLARYAAVQPVALIFGNYPCEFVPFAPPLAYQAWEWRWHDLLAANPNGHFAWHSDAPPVGPVAPLLHLYAMVTGKEVSQSGTGTCDTPFWLARESFTVTEVLPWMTIDAAYALFREEEVGSLRAGKLADLVVLSANPLTVNPEQIRDIQVQMTLVGGQAAYCAPGSGALCPGGF